MITLPALNFSARRRRLPRRVPERALEAISIIESDREQALQVERLDRYSPMK